MSRLFSSWSPIAICVAAVFVFLCAAVTVAAPFVGNNFHTVVAGEAYRSAQPSADDIRLYSDRNGIATILNLRGPKPGTAWYDAEVTAARDLGIRHIDFPMSARRELTREQAERLVEIMRDAPKPLLIHCRRGADRTGLASSLYLAAITGLDERAAERQLSLRYGHYAIPVIGTWEMDLTWETMEPVLGFPDS